MTPDEQALCDLDYMTLCRRFLAAERQLATWEKTVTELSWIVVQQHNTITQLRRDVAAQWYVNRRMGE